MGYTVLETIYKYRLSGLTYMTLIAAFTIIAAVIMIIWNHLLNYALKYRKKDSWNDSAEQMEYPEITHKLCKKYNIIFSIFVFTFCSIFVIFLLVITFKNIFHVPEKPYREIIQIDNSEELDLETFIDRYEIIERIEAGTYLVEIKDWCNQ